MNSTKDNNTAGEQAAKVNSARCGAARTIPVHARISSGTVVEKLRV